jgi:hypothetical protein
VSTAAWLLLPCLAAGPNTRPARGPPAVFPGNICFLPQTQHNASRAPHVPTHHRARRRTPRPISPDLTRGREMGLRPGPVRRRGRASSVPETRSLIATRRPGSPGSGRRRSLISVTVLCRPEACAHGGALCVRWPGGPAVARECLNLNVQRELFW